MSRSRIALLCLAVLLGGCTAGSPPPTRDSLSPGATSPSTGGASEARLEPIVLVADLSERPAAWERVAFIPFGPEAAELGFIHDVHVASVALIPRSFAVDRDGSFWIADRVKSRLAHYSAEGDYLGQVTGPQLHVRFGFLRDVAMAPGGPVALQEVHPLIPRVESILTVVHPGGDLSSRDPVVRGRDLYVGLVFPAPDAGSSAVVIGGVHGFAELAGIPPGEFARFDLGGPGDGSYLPGLPLFDGGWARLTAPSEQDFEVTFGGIGARFTQPLHVRVVTGPGADARELVAAVGPGIEVAPASGVGIVVDLAPGHQEDAERYGGGRWYLQIGRGGEPLIWERLPYGLHQQEEQVRHLATGPDGALYLMVLTRRGEVIYRRP